MSSPLTRNRCNLGTLRVAYKKSRTAELKSGFPTRVSRPIQVGETPLYLSHKPFLLFRTLRVSLRIVSPGPGRRNKKPTARTQV